MDYIYAELNKTVEQLKYKGVETETAKTIVTDSEISVKVKADSEPFIREINNQLARLNVEDDQPEGFVKSIEQKAGKIIVSKMNITEADVEGLVDDLSNKQDSLYFIEPEKYPYSEENPVVTKNYINDLQQAGMHFKGIYEHIEDFINPDFGDVIIVKNVEYLYQGSALGWHSFADVSQYIKKGEVTEQDIQGTISTEKVNGLDEKLEQLDNSIEAIDTEIEDEIKPSIPNIDLKTEEHKLVITY